MVSFRGCVGIWLSCAGLTVLVSGGLFPVKEQTAQLPIFKGRVDTVRVEVAVIDNRTGKPVVGLTAQNFSLVENGVPQTISTFVSESDEGVSETAGAQTGNRSRRVFLFVFGGTQQRSQALRLEGPVNPYNGVQEFIRRRLRPTDLAAVMVLNRVTRLTTDHSLLAEVVERVKRPSADSFSRLLAHLKSGVDPNSQAQREVDAWLAPPGAPADFIRSIAAALSGTMEYQQNSVSGHWDRWLGFFDVLKVAAGIEYLRPVEGEKHLVLLNNFGLTFPVRFENIRTGFLLDSAEEDRRLAVRANDAGVALDIIHTAGTVNFAPSTISSTGLAEHSGGQFTSLRTAEEQLARIDDASRSGYVLGYVPLNQALDGKYRSVRVEVDRKNVTLVYRRGYSARAGPPPIDPADVLVRARLRDAAASDLPFTDIPMMVDARHVQGLNREVSVRLTIDAAKLSLARVMGRWTGRLDVMILCGDARQHVVGKVEQQMTLNMTDAMHELAKTTGIPYAVTLKTDGPVSRVKVIVYELASDLLGVSTGPVR